MSTSPDLTLASRYGGFDPQTGDYVIRDVFTPRPWVNVLANERYGAVISQAGSGFSWYGNCQLLRLNRWDQDLVEDNQGRYLMFHEEGRVWSITLQPTKSRARREVRHGLGFTEYRAEMDGLSAVQTCFVPTEDPCEAWIISLTNTSSRPRTLDAGFLLDWALGGPGDWHQEFHRLFAECSVLEDTVTAWKHPELREHSDQIHQRTERAFVRIVGLEDLKWTTDKTDFVGRLGTASCPEALITPEWAPHRSGRWDVPVAGGKGRIELNPAESKSFVVMIGVEEGVEAASALAAKLTLEWAGQELESTKAFWNEFCTRTKIQTGDEGVDIMFNRWLPYQAFCGRMVARCAYYQQGGAYGYRDQLQDSLMLLMIDPELTLAQLIRHAEAMYEDGSVRHWWHPGTPIFSMSRHSDTCLWLSFGLQAYLEETGDFAALDHECGYLSKETEALNGTSGTLLDHALRGVKRALILRAPSGLPLIGAGDWNDGLSHAGLKGSGESVWMGIFLFHIITQWAPILRRLGHGDLANEFLAEAESLRRAVNEKGWMGEYYAAGFNDEGKAFGAPECKEGRIFLMPQIWSVISGIASEERQEAAMDAVRRHLLKPYGPLLLTPAYTQVDPQIGYITRYAPGLRENGGVYTHAATWCIQAFAMRGDIETAKQVALGLLPPYRSMEDPDLYAAEPFVMPGNSDGPDSPYESRAGWTWYTGSAAWMRRMILEWLCGVRAKGGALDAGLDRRKAWPEARISRWHKGESHRLR
jgi:cellobiose phosphorylase